MRPPTEAASLFGDFFKLTRKMEPSLGGVSKRYRALSDISSGLRHFVGGLPLSRRWSVKTWPD
jgi:hypothetical protein